MSKFNVIYADPPWKYDNEIDKAIRGKNTDLFIENHYPTMSIEEIKNLEVDPYGVVYADPPWHFKRDECFSFGLRFAL